MVRYALAENNELEAIEENDRIRNAHCIPQEERYSRQADLVPIEKLSEIKATVIGVGAIGRQVALQLAAIGTPHITLIDFDTVEGGNLAAQGFLEADLGLPKVEAVAANVHKINNNCEVIAINDRFRNKMELGNIVFSCVDKISIRGLIWRKVEEKVKNMEMLFIDGRMAAEALRVLVAHNPLAAIYYPTTLFAQEEAFQGSCTAKTTIYSSNVIAGIMVAQMAKHLRNLPLDYDIYLNLLTNEITVIDSKHPWLQEKS